MDQAQRKVSKIKDNLPANNLKQEDLKFIAELVSYIGVLNGRNQLSISIHDSFNSRYKVIIAKMPSINFDDVRQIEMMNKRIKSIIIDLSRGYLIVESWKHGKEREEKVKKRARENDEYIDLPKSFKFEKVDKDDLPQIKGILQLFVNATELEFTIELKESNKDYEVLLKDMELLNITKIDSVLHKFKAFINQVHVDFPQKQLRVSVRKSDSPLEQIAPYRRKVKLQKI